MSNTPKYERVGPSLYRRGGVILAHVYMSGRASWRSTGTNNPKEARAWLQKWKREKWMIANGLEPAGVSLHHDRVTVPEILDDYLKAGCPSRKPNRRKSPRTIETEVRHLAPLRAYFRNKPAAGLGIHDCDEYQSWRNSGGFIGSRRERNGRVREIHTRGGNRSVDAELQTLCNALNFAVRRRLLKSNGLIGRGRYTIAEDIRHCREVAPTPDGLVQIDHWLRERKEAAVADLVCFLAYSGLRLGEALPLGWEAVNWGEGILHVVREKRGVNPWVAIISQAGASAMNPRLVIFTRGPVSGCSIGRVEVASRDHTFRSSALGDRKLSAYSASTG